MGSSQSIGIEEEASKSHFLKKPSSIGVQNKDNEEFQDLLLTVIKQSQTKNVPIINSPDLEQFQRFFNESRGDTEKFFELIEQRISDLYINLSKQTLELMCDKKLQSTQGKIFISQEILFTSINILKTVGTHTNFKYDSVIVNRLNGLQLSMLGYMKAKYPRQSQNFVPGELMHEFKNFDFVQQPQNDVLRHLKVCFGLYGQQKLLQQVKKFINSLLGQIDSSYPKFEKLLSERVFVVTKQGKQYSVENMIGRKIPQNVDRMSQDVDTPIDLKSPEIFRVIVKWVNDMQDYILNPEDEVKQKDHFKVVKLSQNQIQYDYISTDELQRDLPTLQMYLENEKQQFQNDLKDLKSHIQLFNHNLIKVLTKAQRKQRYVPKRQAQIIKYSMFNKKLLSWMVIQKLMIVLTKLIKASKNFEQSCGVKLDLVKFNVTDLLRARMSGNKFQILKVFLNLKNLENEGKIKILKIKNRLETPMNDAMLIFKMTDSFIICQLQLILMDNNQSFTQKLKNIETLNHFFYELERSPYGVMAELAALLSFKDNKTNFQQKITFNSITEFDSANCLNAHPQDVEKEPDQKKPFICSKCTQFYGSYQNTYMYHYCKSCNQYECIKCLISQKKYVESELRKNAMTKKIQNVLQDLAKKQKNHVLIYSSDNFRVSQFANQKKYLDQVQILLNNQNVIVLRQLSKKKYVITFKELQKYFKDKRQMQYVSNKIYFSICRFIGKNLNIYAMKEDKFNKVSYCFDYGVTHPDKFMHFGYFDFLVVNTKQYVNQGQKQKIQGVSNISIFSNFTPPKQEEERKLIVHYKEINQAKQIVPICDNILIFDFVYKLKKKHKQIKEDQNNSDYEDSYAENSKKEFQYESLEQLRKYTPDFVQAQQFITLTNEGITSDLLDYFQKITWKQKIKFLNLNENKLIQVSILLTELPNLETLILSRNYIRQLNFTKKLLNLKKLVANCNQISQFKGISNIQNVVQINLNENYIQQFPLNEIPLPNLRQLDLKFNQLRPYQKINQTYCPKLVHLTLNGIRDAYGVRIDPPFNIQVSKLKICSLREYSVELLSIKNAVNLQQLTLQQMLSKKFVLESARNLKSIIMKNCTSAPGQYNNGYESEDYQRVPQTEQKIEDTYFMPAILQDEFPQLTTLNLQYSWQIGVLPVLKMPQLKQIFINCVKTSDISNFTHSKLDNLEQFSIVGLYIGILPIFNLPKVRSMKFSGSTIEDAKNLSKWDVPALQYLELSNLTAEAEIGSFGNITCSQFELHGGKFKEGSEVQNNNIKILRLKTINCQHFPIFKMQNLSELNMQFCSKVNPINLQKCYLPNLKKLTGINLFIQQKDSKLSVLKYPSLQELTLLSVNLQDVSNLSFSELPNLKIININDNQISKIPILNCPNLTELNLARCKISDLGGLSSSNLPKLTKLNCQQNKIKQFPVLKFPNLTHISFSDNLIQSINNLGLSELPKLKVLNLKGATNQISQIPPKINLPELEDLRLEMTRLKNIEGFNSFMRSNMKQLFLCNAKLDFTTLPKLNFPQLITLDISNSNIDNIQNLKHSYLPKLKLLTTNNCFVTQLPVMKFPNLSKIKANNIQKNKEQKKCLISIKNLQFSQLPELQTLELQSNLISELPRMKFPKLVTIYLSGNCIIDIQQFKKSRLPAFRLLNIYDNKITELPVSKDVRPLSLYMKDAEVKNFNQLTQYAPCFQNFYYNDSVMPQKFPKCVFKKVKILQFMRCSIISIDEIVRYPMQEIIELSFTGNQIVKVPRFDYPKLKKIYFNMNLITDVKQFMKSKLPSANMISFDTNELQDMCDFPFETVQQVYFSHNKVKDISCMSKYSFINLKMLVFWDLKISKLCKLKAPNITKIYLNGNKIQNLNDMKGSTLPNLNLLQLSDNEINDISGLNEMKLQRINSIYLQNNKLKKMPRLNLSTLTLLNVSKSPIQNIDEFLEKRIDSLTIYYSLDRAQPARSQNMQKIKDVYSEYCLHFVELDQ